MKQLRIIFYVTLYLLSPIDLAPEIILGPLGLVDDLFVVIIGLRKCLHPSD